MDKEKYTVQNLVITTTEYAENATVHGIKYIFEKVNESFFIVEVLSHF